MRGSRMWLKVPPRGAFLVSKQDLAHVLPDLTRSLPCIHQRIIIALMPSHWLSDQLHYIKII